MKATGKMSIADVVGAGDPTQPSAGEKAGLNAR